MGIQEANKALSTQVVSELIVYIKGYFNVAALLNLIMAHYESLSNLAFSQRDHLYPLLLCPVFILWFFFLWATYTLTIRYRRAACL